jgi:putative membrane protein (TIGR04086 family)
MDDKGFVIKVGKGVLRSTILTVLMIVLLSIVMNTVELTNPAVSVVYMLITCISIVYGAIYAARRHNKKGWLTGLLVALFYMIILYLISAIFFQNAAIESKDLFRLLIAAFVGILSGMLGINL